MSSASPASAAVREEAGARPGPGAGEGREGRPRLGWVAALVAVLGVALALRVWGATHGLPYVYNIDEATNFVPRAIGFFGHGFNPGYFINPPAFTYLIHVVLAVTVGGRDAVGEAYALDPERVFLAARLTSAGLGTIAVGLVYLAGARLFDRRVGLLAAALLAVAFLPVFYSHLALNDVPALAPVALALVAAARLHRGGGPADLVLGGVAVGLASATKYTAGIVLLAVLAAAITGHRARRAATGGGRPRVGRVLLAVVLVMAAALAGFLVAHPYALLDFEDFRDALQRQSEASAEGGKLGLATDNGVLYYLRTLTWGLGWIPALAALGGAGWLLVRRPGAAAVLVPAPVLLLLFLGFQDRFFGRYLLPAFPFACLLAAWAALALADAVGRRRPRLALLATAVVAIALLAQGALRSIHTDLALSRPDTRTSTRAWLHENIPGGTKIVVEPIVPNDWFNNDPRVVVKEGRLARYTKFPTSRSTLNNDGTRRRGNVSRTVRPEDYERTTRPGLLRAYLGGGYCWVVTGSTQRDRAVADAEEVPRALAYYAELERVGTVVHRESPYDPGAEAVPFDFDFSFNAYPLAYDRPGPLVTVYRLKGGKCG